MEPARHPKYFTIDDIYNLPEGKTKAVWAHPIGLLRLFHPQTMQ